MTEFTFNAPNLFEPAATPSDGLRDALHDAPAMADHLARINAFALWLKAEMDKKRLSTKGPFADEGGWLFEASSNVGFVVCIVSGPDGGSEHFHMLVSEIGGASADFGHAVEAILRNSSEIAELNVKP